MTLILRDGQLTLSGNRDENGHRTYKIKWLIESTTRKDGPANVMTTAGLPLPGSLWLIDDDTDIYAWCRQDMDVQPAPGYEEGDPVEFWTLEQTFSTKPTKRCGEQQFDDPLMEPMEVSGETLNKNIEGVVDRFGSDISNSAFEPIRGSNNEWSDTKHEVNVKQNVPNLELALCSSLMRRGGAVNSTPMWGLNPRCVHLKAFKWTKKWYGFCYYYYTREFQFEVDEETFDRAVVDEGTMCLRGDWDRRSSSPTYKQWVLAPDIKDDINAHNNPAHFIKFKDWNGENARCILNGFGRPWDPGTISPAFPTGTGTGADTTKGVIDIEYYEEADLLTLLGLPTTL